MRKNSIDMTSGPILSRLIVFIIPLILSSLLQQLYNTADMIVAGRFIGAGALAAIGATSSLYNLIINFINGLAVGASTVVAQNQGAKDKEAVHRSVHTSMAIAIIGGIFIAIVGNIVVRPMLELMDTPPEVIDQSVLYLRIFFAANPVTMIYNFGAAILRAKGDSKRPLYILGITGLVNVVLNIVFVIGFGMGVEGVAIPTVIANALSAVMVAICLIKDETHFKLIPSKIRIWKDQLGRLLSIGVPVGIQSTLFSITNIMIQSSINSLGAMAMAGAAARGKITIFTTAMFNSITQACSVFCGQNFGAKKYGRMIKVMLCCGLIGTVIYLITCPVFLIFGRQLLSLFTTEKEAIEHGMEALIVMASTMVLESYMGITSSSLRSMDKSLISMVNVLLCVITIRFYWVFVYFPAHRSMTHLFISYPVTWLLTIIMQVVCFIYFYRKLKKEDTMLEQ